MARRAHAILMLLFTGFTMPLLDQVGPMEEEALIRLAGCRADCARLVLDLLASTPPVEA